MRFLKRLAIGTPLLIAAFLVVVWFQPDDYRLTRQTVIAAPAAAVFAQVNDLEEMGRLVALGEVRSERQGDVLRAAVRTGCDRSSGTATTRSAPAR